MITASTYFARVTAKLTIGAACAPESKGRANEVLLTGCTEPSRRVRIHGNPGWSAAACSPCGVHSSLIASAILDSATFRRAGRPDPQRGREHKA